MLATAIILLLVLLAIGIPVAAVLFVMAIVLDWWFLPAPLYKALATQLWDTSTSFILVAIPLFILIGEILLRSGIAAKVYESLDSWLSWLPGGLMHANIGASTFFAATSGSSVATAATIGTIALPQAPRFGYNDALFAGSIAAGGTLGILIPPSINLIIYGFLAKTSIPQLFVAGIIPGLLLAACFMGAIFAICVIRPEWDGARRSSSMAVRLGNLRHLVPVLVLFGFIMGSIYTGWATPTEAAAIGMVIALALAWMHGGLSWRMLGQALEGTMRTTAMIMLILIVANFLNFILASAGLANKLIAFIAAQELSPTETILLLVLMYVILGFFIETLSLMIVTIPFVAPLVAQLGFDLVWFGILLIVLIEMALITPPVGLNLYVVQGVRGRGSLTDVILGAIPFALMMLLMVALLIAFPGIALFLPRLAAG
jgi:tripartite ATP-independent transporter DctM subunit